MNVTDKGTGWGFFVSIFVGAVFIVCAALPLYSMELSDFRIDSDLYDSWHNQHSIMYVLSSAVHTETNLQI